jgi:hypothetical protein
MPEINSKVEFEPAEMTIGTGRIVRVTLSHDKGPHHEPHLGGFKTKMEARGWIARESAEWLKG